MAQVNFVHFLQKNRVCTIICHNLDLNLLQIIRNSNLHFPFELKKNQIELHSPPSFSSGSSHIPCYHSPYYQNQKLESTKYIFLSSSLLIPSKPLVKNLQTVHLVFFCVCVKWRRCVLNHFSCVQLFATLWAVACQAPLSLGFSRKEDWSQQLFPS